MKKTLMLIAYIVAFVLITAGLALVFSQFSVARANTIAGNPAKCIALASDAGAVTNIRDAGMPWDKFLEQIEPRVQQAIRDKRSYIADSEDYYMVLGTFWYLWKHPEIGNDRAMEVTHEACMEMGERLKQKSRAMVNPRLT